NPCPCGNHGSPEKECTCNQSQVASYKRKLTGPLIDRFDIFCHVPGLKYEELINQETPENCGEDAKAKITKAREIQNKRFKIIFLKQLFHFFSDELRPQYAEKFIILADFFVLVLNFTYIN
ncbi:MAG: ATP-binding protein, partial [Candidatus Omnitrophica bacterium]|nr:ATP-binding protein [Candidatus Omnitrophota bacterium]